MNLPVLMSVLVGFLLVVAVVRDVLHELFHPAGTGTLSRRARQVIWAGFHRYARGQPRRLRMAGPSALVAIIALWSVLATVGWALIYLPFLPTHFRYASPLVPSAEDGFGTALYVSLVALSTLGFGDVTPTSLLLRVVVTLEAFLGFLLITAGISWALSIKPVLAARRSLAATIATWRYAERCEAVQLDQLGADDVRPVLLALTQRMALMRANLLQSPETYYFVSEDADASLPAVLPYLLVRVRTLAGRADDVTIRFHATALQRGIDQLASTVGEQFLSMRGAQTDVVLAAYARDHLRTAAEAEP